MHKIFSAGAFIMTRIGNDGLFVLANNKTSASVILFLNVKLCFYVLIKI